MNGQLSKIRSVHTYVIPRTVYLGWICRHSVQYYSWFKPPCRSSITFMGQGVMSNFGIQLFKLLSILIPLMPTFGLVIYNGIQLEAMITRSNILKQSYEQVRNYKNVIKGSANFALYWPDSRCHFINCASFLSSRWALQLGLLFPFNH